MKTRLSGILLILLLFCGYSATTQVKLSTVTLNAGGNYFQNETFKLSSSIGEMVFVHTIFLPDFIITNGVLQPLVRNRVADRETAAGIYITVYPTITSSHYVYLDARLKDRAGSVVNIYNMQGQLTGQKTITIPSGGFKEKIQLPSAQAGEYMIEVILKGSELTAPYRCLFKIQQL